MQIGYIDKNKHYINQATNLTTIYDNLAKECDIDETFVAFIKQSECLGEYQEIEYQRLSDISRLAINRREEETGYLWIIIAENDIPIKLKKGEFVIKQFLIMQLDKTFYQK